MIEEAKKALKGRLQPIESTSRSRGRPKGSTKGPGKVGRSIRLPPELDAELQHEARVSNVSVSAIVEQCLRAQYGLGWGSAAKRAERAAHPLVTVSVDDAPGRYRLSRDRASEDNVLQRGDVHVVELGPLGMRTVSCPKMSAYDRWVIAPSNDTKLCPFGCGAELPKAVIL